MSMVDIHSKYLGLDLRNPIIVGSSHYSGDVESLLRMEQAGVGAVILKPMFEEEFIYDIKQNTHEVAHVNNYGESYAYVSSLGRDGAVPAYLDLIAKAKETLSIPVIACIDCFSYESWITYAKQLEEAGCDAVQLNVSILPLETSLSADDVERSFNDIIRTMKRITSLPIDVKVSPYFTDLAKFMQQLSWMGIQGISIFNRPLLCDVDVENIQLIQSDATKGIDLYDTLMWLSILKNKLRCDLSAIMPTLSSDLLVKMLLMGAGSVQVSLGREDFSLEGISQMQQGLQAWMEHNGFSSLKDFVGRLALPVNEKSYMVMRTMMMKDFI